MKSEKTLMMMFGRAAALNRDMYQINIASMEVLLQLVQVVVGMREVQCVIMDALDRMPGDGGQVSDRVDGGWIGVSGNRGSCGRAVEEALGVGANG